MKTRADLSKELHALIDNVYFQPPESVKLKYPCIIYSLERPDVDYADDDLYSQFNHYNLILITQKPDSPLIDEIPRSFRFCSLDRPYVADNLYHYSFTLYY